MLSLANDPAASYRRVELDARVEGSDGAGLTRICLEEAIADLNLAGTAQRSRDVIRRNAALGRAIRTITALSAGIAADNPLRREFQLLYGGARHAVSESLADYRQAELDRVRGDLEDILRLLQRPAQAAA